MEVARRKSEMMMMMMPEMRCTPPFFPIPLSYLILFCTQNTNKNNNNKLNSIKIERTKRTHVDELLLNVMMSC